MCFFPQCRCVCVCVCKGTSSLFLSRIGGVFWNVTPHTLAPACTWIAPHASSSPGRENECGWVGGWIHAGVWVFLDYSVVYRGIRLTTSAALAERLPRKVHHHHQNWTDDFMMTVIWNTDFLLSSVSVFSSMSFTECEKNLFFITEQLIRLSINPSSWDNAKKLNKT